MRRRNDDNVRSFKRRIKRKSSVDESTLQAPVSIHRSHYSSCTDQDAKCVPLLGKARELEHMHRRNARGLSTTEKSRIATLLRASRSQTITKPYSACSAVQRCDPEGSEWCGAAGPDVDAVGPAMVGHRGPVRADRAALR